MHAKMSYVGEWEWSYVCNANCGQDRQFVASYPGLPIACRPLRRSGGPGHRLCMHTTCTIVVVSAQERFTLHTYDSVPVIHSHTPNIILL